jgi:nitrilase
MDIPYRQDLFPDSDEWVNPGDAVVYRPFGGIAAGPMHREKGLLIAEIDPAEARASRRKFDVAGHYARPDVFSFGVDRTPHTPFGESTFAQDATFTQTEVPPVAKSV